RVRVRVRSIGPRCNSPNRQVGVMRPVLGAVATGCGPKGRYEFMPVLRTWHVTEPRPVGSGIMIQDSLCALLTAHCPLPTAHRPLTMGCVCSQSFATEARETGEKNQALKSNIMRL